MMPLARRDRVIIVVALSGLAAVSWLYMYRLAGQMGDMAMPAAFSPWTAADFAVNFVIWWVMALLFAAGMMSLVWMAAITAFVLAEKLFPGGRGSRASAASRWSCSGSIRCAPRR